MPRIRGEITDRLVEKMTPPEHGAKITYDRLIPGFGVRITAAGVVAFILDYRALDKREGKFKKHRYTIGRYPVKSSESARTEAKELLANRLDPLAEKRGQKEKLNSEPTMNDLAKAYMEEHALPFKRATSAKNDQRKIAAIIQPKLGEFKVAGITRDDIKALYISLRPTKYRANRVLALLSKMFNLAVVKKWRADNPVSHWPKEEKYREQARTDWLKRDEIASLKKALDNYHDQNAADAIRLLMLTGARESEVLKADWKQFDLKRAVWTKPSHHTKQKEEHHTPLGDHTLALLRKMRPQSSGPLFPGANGSSRVTLRRPWKQVCRAAGLATSKEMKGKRRTVTRHKPKYRIHDLRHTYASHLVSNGVSLEKVGELLGHTNPQTTKRYAHLADKNLRDATNQFGDIYTTARA